MVEDRGISFIVIAERVDPNLRAQANAMNDVCRDLGCDCEIVVLSQASSEQTQDVAGDVENLRQIQHAAIDFCSSALRTGMKNATHERVVVCFSADLVTAHSIEQMVRGLEHYDLICGIRPVLGRGVRAAVYRWVWHKLVRLLFNVRLRDINCPYKALLRSKAREVGFLESEGSLTHTELIARMKAMGARVAELPLESFHFEGEKLETYNPIILTRTLWRLVSLKRHIGKTQRRLADESDFHDAWASTIDVAHLLVRETFEAVTAGENRYAITEMGDIDGKHVLDLGCGAGESSVYFALKGATVTAADISKEMLHVADELASRWNVHIDTKVIVGEDIDLPSESYDYVYGNAVLHHLDRKKAYSEILRVLKPGGQAIFIEPLCYNPVISVYRLIARTVRTKNEKPFRFRDFQYLRRIFQDVKHREFWLATQLVFIYFFIVKRVSPRKERYWKKVIADADSRPQSA